MERESRRSIEKTIEVSAIGYMALGAVIEAVSGHSYETSCDPRILEALLAEQAVYAQELDDLVPGEPLGGVLVHMLITRRRSSIRFRIDAQRDPLPADMDSDTQGAAWSRETDQRLVSCVGQVVATRFDSPERCRLP